MKSLIVFGLLVSSQVFAVTSSDSWETILNARNVKTSAQTVAFAAGEAVTFVSVLDVCVLNESQFMTNEPQNIIDVVFTNNRSKEVVVGQERLVGSNKSKTVPAIDSGDYNSTKPPFYTTISTTQYVDVLYKDSSATARKLFTKKFTIPNCQ